MVSNSVGRRQDAVVARSTFCMPPCFGALPSKRASAQPAQISVRIARGRATEAAPGCRRMTSTPAQRGQRRATLRITHTEWAMRCVGQSASAIDLIGFCAHAFCGATSAATRVTHTPLSSLDLQSIPSPLSTAGASQTAMPPVWPAESLCHPTPPAKVLRANLSRSRPGRTEAPHDPEPMGPLLWRD
jgi:hypothetical protein